MAAGDLKRIRYDEAPAWLGHLDVTSVTHTDGNITRIDYENTAVYTSNYEIYAYNTDNQVTTIQHFIGGTQRGTTTVVYTAGFISSSTYTEI